MSAQPEVTIGTHPNAGHSIKKVPLFLTADGEASRSVYPSLVSLLSSCTAQPENTYFCIHMVTSQI